MSKLEEEGIKKRRTTSSQQVELFPDLIWVWDFFNLLNRQRQVGPHGPQPISLTDISNLADMRGYHREYERDFLLTAIPELDGIFLKDSYEQIEKAMKKNAPKGGKKKI